MTMDYIHSKQWKEMIVMQQNPKESKSVLKANSKQVNNTLSEYNKYQNIEEIKKKSRVFPKNPFFLLLLSEWWKKKNTPRGF